ncbi:MAG: ketopantoate reductase family protein [Geminicoccaceae bacterium]
MRVAIMGSGGVGGYVGGRLAAAGEEVAFIARGAHLQAMQTHGLRIESALGDATIRSLEASDDPAAIGPADLVIFAVKLYDTEAAAEACRPLLGPQTGVLTLQNGVESSEVLARVLGARHVIGGVAQIATVIAAPGVIRHTGTMCRLQLGELDGQLSPRVAGLSAALERAGLQHQVSADIQRDIWAKMVFLAPMSGMTSLMRLPIGPIREDPETRAMLHAAIAEAVAMAGAKGADLGGGVTLQRMAFIDGLPYEMRSSMLEDLERGRPLELPWLSGAIARMGKELGIATPVHTFITTTLKLHVGGRA